MPPDFTALIAQVRQSLPRASGVVAAVSGGGDSVAMLRILADLRAGLELRLSVAHLDHGTRGEASRADSAFVADLAEGLGLPIDLGSWSPRREGHFEEDARAARYAWLVEVAGRRGAAFVAAGHTRDDQAETVLHRIVRGTGLRGLAGMPRRRRLAEGVTLIRPLLGASRESLRGYLGAIGQACREDATNDDLARTRNRIRRDLLPRIAAEYNPNVVEALDRLASFAREDGARRRRRVERIAREAVISADASAIVMRRSPLRALSPATRAEIFRLAWRRAGWPEAAMTSARWLRLASAGEGRDGRFSAGAGIDAWVAADTLRLVPAPKGTQAARSSSLRLPVPGRLPERQVSAMLDADAPRDEEIDLDRVAFWSDGRDERFLLVGVPEDGDRFDPLGLGGHSQGLNDFFRGRGVAKAERDEVPVVRDKTGILWVVGHRIAHRVRVTAETKRVLALRWEGARPGFPRPAG